MSHTHRSHTHTHTKHTEHTQSSSRPIALSILITAPPPHIRAAQPAATQALTAEHTKIKRIRSHLFGLLVAPCPNPRGTRRSPSSSANLRQTHHKRTAPSARTCIIAGLIASVDADLDVVQGHAVGALLSLRQSRCRAFAALVKITQINLQKKKTRPYLGVRRRAGSRNPVSLK